MSGGEADKRMRFAATGLIRQRACSHLELTMTLHTFTRSKLMIPLPRSVTHAL
jgi:hypothetical protein